MMDYGIGMFLAGLVIGAGIGWYVAFFYGKRFRLYSPPIECSYFFLYLRQATILALRNSLD